MSATCWLVAWLLAAAGVAGPRDAEVTVSGPHPSPVSVGARATVKLAVTGAEDVALVPLPGMTDLDVAIGVPREEGGETSLTLELTPLRPGRFDLGPFAVFADGAVVSAGAVALDAVVDASAAGRAWVEVAAPPGPIYTGQTVPVEVRFGLARRFLTENVLPPFPRRLDVPAQLRAAWDRRLDGGRWVDDGPDSANPSAAMKTFAWDDSVARAVALPDRVVDGVTYAVFRCVRRLRCDRPGALVVPGVVLRCVYATEFRDDFFDGRVAIDRRELFAYGEGPTVRFEAPPEQGRPASFRGAVGRFTVDVASDRAQVAVGESLRVTLTVRGDGDLDAMGPPPLNELIDFHIYGRIDERDGDERRFLVDLTPLRADVTVVPSLPFSSFDPSGAGRYRTVWTRPLALRVTPAADDSVELTTTAAELPPWSRWMEDSGAARSSGARPAASRRSAGSFLALTVFAPWLVFGGMLLARRRRRAVAHRRPEVTAAARDFRRRAAGVDPLDALTRFLAVVCRDAPPSAISPALARRLREHGVPGPLAESASDAVGALLSARYGGPTQSMERDLDELVTDIARCATGDESADPRRSS